MELLMKYPFHYIVTCLLITFVVRADELTIEKLVQDTTVPEQHRELLLNVLYWSYARSEATINLVNNYQEPLRYMHQISHNFHDTRRNPSRSLPYNIAKKEAIAAFSSCIKAYTQYLETAQTYAACVNYVLKEYSDLDPRVHTYLTKTKDELRASITLSLKPYMSCLSAIQNSLSLCIHPKSFSSFIMGTIPLYAAKAFSKVDQICTTLFHRLWLNEEEHLKTFDTAWTVLETRRSAFYKDLYTRAYQASQILFAPHILFDQKGLLDDQQKMTLLPHPATLGE